MRTSLGSWGQEWAISYPGAAEWWLSVRHQFILGLPAPLRRAGPGGRSVS